MNQKKVDKILYNLRGRLSSKSIRTSMQYNNIFIMPLYSKYGGQKTYYGCLECQFPIDFGQQT